MKGIRNPWLFGLATFCIGWFFQILLTYFPFPDNAAPQLLLVSVIALGALGKTDLAQTLGFCWGLSLDTFGVSLFGSQGWLFVIVAFVTSLVSRQVNVEKPLAQEAITLVGTGFYTVGLFLLEVFFRSGQPHSPSLGAIFLQVVANLLLAPPLFWFLSKWVRIQESGRERTVLHA